MAAAPRRARLGAALAVAGLCAALLLPESLRGWWLTEDATEHLAIAHALAHGAGFVDPVQWAFTLPAAPPLPATAVRPPLLPLLLAPPLALGATLSQVMWLHALFASLVAGALVLVASRFMSLPAAAGAALLLVTAPGWRGPALHPWTEITGVACALAVLASAHGVVRSVPRAAVCAACTLLAWLARPNLGALALAVSAAALLELGRRRALRSAAFWSYPLCFAAGVAAAQLWARAATGYGLYAGYTGEMLAYEEVWSYGKHYVGTLAYVEAHAAEIAAIWRERAGALVRDLCVRPPFHRVGPLLLPGVAYALWARGPGALERRVCAFAALGLALVVVLNYAPYEPRYVLFPALAGSLCLFTLLSDAAAGLEARLGTSARVGAVAWAALLPLLAPLALVAATTGPAAVARSLDAWRAARSGETRGTDPGPFAALCAAMEQDAVVASVRPWPTHLWCGNASVMLPLDLAQPDVRARFLSEKQPRYVIARREAPYAWLAAEPAFRERLASGRLVLYERADAAPTARWRGPPPLACAGRAADCVSRRARPGPARGSVLE